MTLIIPGANITAQWYGDTYPGAKMATLEKFLLHSTETNSWPGYGGGASMPTVTYHPRLRALRQHCDAERSARALRNPSSTPVSENRDNVLQVEIVAYSDYKLAVSRGGLWIGNLTDAQMEDLARIHVWMNKVKGTPLRTDVRWAPGTKTSAGVSGLRLSSSRYDAARGVLAHFHASGNTHWDVGGFDINRYMRAVTRVSGTLPPSTGDDFMGYIDTPAEFDAEVARAMSKWWNTKMNINGAAVAPTPETARLRGAPIQQVVGRVQPDGSFVNVHTVMGEAHALAQSFGINNADGPHPLLDALLAANDDAQTAEVLAAVRAIEVDTETEEAPDAEG